MTSRWAGVHPVDDPHPTGGGITGRDGTHVTDTELDAWVDAFAVPDAVTPMPPARRRGRPTLTGAPDGHSPRITVRLSPTQIDALDALAEHAGTTRARLTRQAVTEYLQRAEQTPAR